MHRHVLPLLPEGSRVLEVGAGAGWQAAILAEAGHRVTAIDIPDGKYDEIAVFPIVKYDGDRFSFPARSFDVVFSSNVLEHVADLEVLLMEVKRVLEPNGIAVFVLPTPTWRIWTILAHYPEVLRRMTKRLRREKQSIARDSRSSLLAGKSGPALSFRQKFKACIFPSRHGVRGNFLTEIYYFSRVFWYGVFRKAGFEVARCSPVGLYYSGVFLADKHLSLHARSTLSRVLGSSGMLYCLVSGQQ